MTAAVNDSQWEPGGLARQAATAGKGWLTGLGILMILLGLAAMVLPLAAGLAVELALGLLFVIGGIGTGYHALRSWGRKGAGHNLFGSLLFLVLGALLLVYPLQGLATLTLFLAAFFIVEGVVKISLYLRLAGAGGRGWLLVNAIASLMVGAVIFLGWPAVSVWAVGILVGIDLVINGMACLFLAAQAPG
jgi:uncharacterized membrane protein HdeD (DUF308 family)